MKEFKILITILLFLFLNKLSSQTKQFLYEYRFISDSTKMDSVSSEIMALNIFENKSEYFNLDQFISDSTLLVNSKKGLMPMPTNKNITNERIEKTINSEKIKYVKRLGFTEYFVDESINLKWKLYPEYATILNYKAQKATTEYGGRKWIAWFAKDIPFQDGPYKFKNLPGLIVKIEDETKSHQFILKGIKNFTDDFIYPELNNYARVELTYQKFIKAYKNYRINPVGDMVGSFPDQTDGSGKFRRGIDIFREFEKYRLDEIAKDNNIIEIDLLK
ncbi:GLPGLI family protein [Frigoriflavimonas asaccharolytica]|uniref:GLPGLI family protein n=1 Tax=Frigoriflavimonas asaccharolytica TaxID=2735899 RepID=A0A8J8GAQ5_9FLAO|nr:GLPGLI family protein [Frigoriflavimonas asaccharolytica]NRS92500.1 GLPGLI family protein [Frigoriflavimonas asaccharolytica]